MEIIPWFLHQLDRLLGDYLAVDEGFRLLLRRIRRLRGWGSAVAAAAWA